MVVFRYLAYGGVKISNGEKIELTKKESYFWEILLLFISSSNSEGIELRQREILSKEWSIFKYIDDQDKLFDYALQGAHSRVQLYGRFRKGICHNKQRKR